MTKEKLILDAIAHGLTKEHEVDKAEKEFRCYQCPIETTCRLAWDAYNIGDDWCLAEK